MDYKPTRFIHDSILNGPPDKVDPELSLIEKEKWPEIKFNEFDEGYNCNRKSFLGEYNLDKDGFPRYVKLRVRPCRKVMVTDRCYFDQRNTDK